MLKGGYQIIDFEGIKVRPNEPITIPDIYNKISSKKAILFSGLKIVEEENVFEIEFNDIFIQFSRSFGESGYFDYRGHLHTFGTDIDEFPEYEVEVNADNTIIFKRY